MLPDKITKAIRARRLCLSCMEVHDVQIISIIEENIYKGRRISYPAEYFYCERSGETYADEEMITANHAAMQNAFSGGSSD